MKGLLKFTLLLCILKSMNYWVFWSIDSKLIYFAAVFSIIVCISNKKRQIWNSIIKENYTIGFLFLAIYALYQNTITLSSNATILSYSNTIMLLYILYSTIHFKEDFKNEIISYLEKAMTILLAPALLIFFLRFVISLPFIPMQYTDSFGNDPYGLLQNYIFLIHHAEAIVDLASFPRFCGPFLEPGQLATFLAFLLFVLKYDFSKRSRYILLFALICSFSLAGYVLALIGAMMQKSHSIKKIIPLIFLISIIYVVGINYNNGNNLLNKYILVRLEYDEEKGITGNDRSSEITDRIFEEELMSSTTHILFGLPHYKGEAIGGSGYKTYIVKYGVFSLFFLLVAYLVISSSARNKRDMLIFSILLIASFLQRATPLIFYLPFLYLIALDNTNLYKLDKR